MVSHIDLPLIILQKHLFLKGNINFNYIAKTIVLKDYPILKFCAFCWIVRWDGKWKHSEASGRGATKCHKDWISHGWWIAILI